MADQQGKKGGKKLRRCGKHKNMYAAQFFRTARNKSNAAKRIARRKIDNPSPRTLARLEREVNAS